MAPRASALALAVLGLTLSGCFASSGNAVEATEREWRVKLEELVPAGMARAAAIEVLEQHGAATWMSEDGALMADVATTPGDGIACVEWKTFATFALDGSDRVANTTLKSHGVCL